MILSGEDFYKQFFCRFQEYVKKDRKRYNKSVKDAAWTTYVKDDFLGELAKVLGFKVTKREGVYAVDLTWEKSMDGISIAIEHENNVETIWKNEVPNLLRTAAQLKVLITYVNDIEFPRREIANKLLEALREANFKKEFLLILGTWSMEEPTDWVGYSYRQEITFRNLVFCSNRLKAESRPGVKAWQKRKTKHQT